MVEHVEYDEFGYFHEIASEFGLSFTEPPLVRRASVDVATDRRLSALIWGETDPELVFLHGGSQNAHTWDTVGLSLARPLVAIDLPGHGHSGGPRLHPDGRFDVSGNAEDVARTIQALAPNAAAVVGMSLGGIIAIAIAGAHPSLTRKLVLVDVLPGVRSRHAQHIEDFVNGPSTFENLDVLLQRTAEFNPNRSLTSLRRGILHNAEQQPDGTWMWRWARHRPESPNPASTLRPPGDTLFDDQWETVERLQAPLLLARGMRPDSVLTDLDESELARRVPSAKIARVDDAGHSLQGDTPLELSMLIENFVFDAESTGS